jgi:hypothetical protein
MHKAAIFALLVVAGAFATGLPTTVSNAQPGLNRGVGEHIDALYDINGNVIRRDFDPMDGVGFDSLYWKQYTGTYLMSSAKAQSPVPANRTAMAFQYSQATPCMEPNGDYVYEVYGSNLRRFSTTDGSYTNFTLSYSGGSGCATDGQYIYVPGSSNSATIYKYTMTGSYVNTTTLNVTCDAYAVSVVNDTFWACPDRYSYTYYAFPTSAFNGGSINYVTSWNVGSGTNGVGNIAFDGTYYYVPFIGASNITFKRFTANRSLYSTGTASIDPRGVMCKRLNYKVSGDSLYFKDYYYSYLRAAPKVQNPTATNSVPMPWQYSQTVTCMTPDGQYVYEVYGTNMRRYKTSDGSYTNYTLSYSGSGPCGTDGNYIFVPNGTSVYKYTMTGTYVNTTTTNVSSTIYGFAVANDTVWLTNAGSGATTYYGYACSKFAGGSINYDATWSVGNVGGSTPMNIAFDGSYYYVVSGGYASNPFYRFYRDRSLYSSGYFYGDGRSVMCRGPYSNGVMIAFSSGYGGYAASLRQMLLDSCGGNFGTVDTYYIASSGHTSIPATEWYNRGYRAVLVFTDQVPANGVTMGDSLGKFIQLGGGVVDAVFADFSGYAIQGLYRSRYAPFTLQTNAYASGSMSTVHYPSHPIMNGVSSITIGNWITGNTHSSLRGSNATCLAEYAAANRCVAACFDSAGQRAVSIGFLPLVYWQSSASGQWCRLIVNALRWVGHNLPEPDVGCSKLIAPSGNVDSGTVVTPACSVYNYGNTTPTSYKVRLRIGTYRDSATVATHAPGTAKYVTFTNWTALPRGSAAVSCSTELAGDVGGANDKKSGTVTVDVKDVSCTRILAPADSVDSGTVVTPACSAYNRGNTTPASYTVRLKIGTAYNNTATVTAHAPGTAVYVSFPNWTASPSGTFATSCSTELTGDMVPANDKNTGSVKVKPAGSGPGGGWSLCPTPVPATPSGKQVKDGGWLAYDVSRARIFAAKGNKTGDFYSYNPANDSWKQLQTWPPGTEAKLPKAGSAGAADGNGKVYATKGNNTQGFWAYDAAGDAWTQKADVPLGPTNKKVKGGTDIVYVNKLGGCGYLLKGYKNEFWRYHVAGDSWHQMQDAPAGANIKWDKGSWLAFDNAHTIYAHKAKYHEFYKYDTDKDSWNPTALVAMPIPGSAGSKKSKDGGCGTWINVGGEAIYALKGGNTSEFWKYTVTANSWAEKDTLPKGAGGKKVKAGADIVAVGTKLYAFKGNKTGELWMYTPGSAVFVPRPLRDGVASEPVATFAAGMTLSPNPLAGGFARLSYGLPQAGAAGITVFDVTGRPVLAQTLVAGRSGTADLDLRCLSAGVYLVKLVAPGFSAAQKLVVQR